MEYTHVEYWDMAMAMGVSKSQAGPAARLYVRYPNKRHPSDLLDEGYHPYRYTTTQHLLPGDLPRRVLFCNNMRWIWILSVTFCGLMKCVSHGHIDSDTSSLISSPDENSIYRSDAEEIGNEVEKRVVKDIHIHSKTNNWYSFLCNRWLSLCGAAVKLLIMFLVHWGYALANIGVVFIVWLYIGHANPAVKPGISAEFKFFTWLKNIFFRLIGKRVQEYEQIVVTPLHPGVEVISSQMNEENEDFSSRKRYHQSSTIQGYSFFASVILIICCIGKGSGTRGARVLEPPCSYFGERRGAGTIFTPTPQYFQSLFKPQDLLQEPDVCNLRCVTILQSWLIPEAVSDILANEVESMRSGNTVGTNGNLPGTSEHMTHPEFRAMSGGRGAKGIIASCLTLQGATSPPENMYRPTLTLFSYGHNRIKKKKEGDL
uniref:Uncharacterized protein n=1 Tax=Timema poppense TaxID=170557 RepID=A0A7R9GY43_TIMPO|nr:unnamed protein product [Timema poppensis]